MVVEIDLSFLDHEKLTVYPGLRWESETAGQDKTKLRKLRTKTKKKIRRRRRRKKTKKSREPNQPEIPDLSLSSWTSLSTFTTIQGTLLPPPPLTLISQTTLTAPPTTTTTATLRLLLPQPSPHSSAHNPPPPSNPYPLLRRHHIPKGPPSPPPHRFRSFQNLLPRTTHRPLPLDSDRPRHRLYLESGPDYRDRSRNYSPRDYDRELHKPYRRDPDGGGARFRSEYEEQRDRRVDDGYRRRSSNHETTTFREVELQDSGSGCYDESAYEELLKSGRRYEAYEIQRWGLERAQSEEDLYDPFELDEHDEEDRIVSDKRDYYGSESGRNSSTSRWKQIQKKSALLRLQTPKARDRNYSAYYDSSGSGGSFRGKEQYEYEYSGHGRKDAVEEERRGGGGEERGQQQRGGSSPLDLDVSFKSNSLVAKPVRTRDEKRGSVSDMDCSESPPAKPFCADVVNLDSLALVSNKTSSPGKEAMKLKGQVTTSGMNSQPCSVVTDDAFVKSEVETAPKGKILHKDGKDVGSSQKSSPNVSKKTKVVKKIVAKKTVKKVTNPPTSQPESKIDEPGTSTVHSLFAGTGKGETSSISDPCPNDLHVLPVDKEVEGSQPNVLSDEYGTVLNSCSKNIGNNSSANLGSLSPAEINTDQKHPLNVDTPVKGLLTISNFNSNATDSIKVASCPETGGVVDVSKSICQSGNILLVDKVVQKESSQAMLAVEGNLSSGFLNSDKMHELTNVKGSEHGAETLEKLSHQEIIVPDVGTVDAVSEQPCRYQLPTSLQNGGVVEELPKAISSAENNMAVGLSSSGETKAVRSKIGRRTRWDSDEVYVKKDKSITVSNGGNTNSFGKQSSPDCDSRSFEICATERSPNIPKSGGDTHSVTPMIQKKRKVKTQLDFSRISDTCVDPVNVSPRKDAPDTTVSSFLKDPSHAEVSVSGVQKLDMGSQPGNDWVSVLNGKSSVNGFSDTKLSATIDANYDTNETSPEYLKRRKVSGTHLVLTSAQTNGGPANKSTSYIQESSTHNDVPTYQADKGASSSIGSQCATSNLIPSPEEINVYLEDIMAAVSSDTVAAARDSFTNDDMKIKHQGIDSSSVSEGSGIPHMQILCPLQSQNEDKEDGTEVMVVNNHHLDILDIDGSHEKDFDVCATNEHIMVQGETAPCTIHSELQPADLGINSFSTNIQSDYLCVKDKLPFVPSCLLSIANGNEVTSTNSIDEGMKSVSDTLSDTGTPETSTSITDVHMLICNPSVIKSFDEKVCADDQKFEVKSEVASAGNLFSETKTNLTLDNATEGHQSVTEKAVPLKLQDSKKTSHGLHLISAESALKNQLGQATHRIVPGRPFSAFTTSQKATSSTHISKPRTWHRNANSSVSPLPVSTLPPQRQLPQRNGKLESNSYVRKGNTLVRRRATIAAVPQISQGLSSSVHQLNFSGIDGLKKNAGSDSRVDIKNPPRTGGLNASSDRPPAPLPSGVKMSASAAVSSGIPTSSPLAEPLLSDISGTKSDPMNCSETKDAEGSVKDSLATSDTQEYHSGPVNNLHDGNLASSNMKKVIYVKRKLNQLVASSSNPSDLSVHNADKNQPSDGYYKRRKHQLIRSSLECNGKDTVLLPTDNINSGEQKARKVIPSRTFNKKRSLKAVARMSKKNSLVWTPSGSQSSNNNGSSYDHQKVLPQLFPWKRARYWRTVMQSQASNFNYSSSSTISKKLLLSRMRDTVYTRSTHGFSLRKYKVLSVGGSSLKWSKSIESRSKKVNEEATRAVAEVEKKKREHNGAACTSSGSKIRNSPGKRIFRIGSVRYKMDPSRRTLKRISDDESSKSVVLNPETNAKRSYVPRRLVIGNDEYVRIGNGNQLIRDPKKRTRILASERVRWSLHTARQRLAKKRKYCQFFTRFGKCNKDDGKCPYIHDSSKIAVCTKYLNGLCSNPNCRLTHKVIPERMPDCSFFLQGLCTNKNCSYRHVNVNPKASTCEGFLKGYCADGNECRKKHSYVCQTFEETGTCPQGPKCKLHHPKKRMKGKIKKRSREHRNGWGRYFVSKDVGVSEPVTASAKHCAQNGDDIFGNDFVSINVSDEEAGESNNPPEQTTFYDSDPSELDLDDLDELIKPVRLLNKMKTNIY
ncbi:putative transcription factor C3H family [Rosa chinensis]|uniref:Putative transcription factor C3H family n=1 Tax=Rosa chinensis TaxID=74649 RepID=A0A2P6PXI6_ROSCH|nr:putative transcription factor C3H family [Rosa chinensis]